MKKSIITEIINSLYSSTKCPNCQHSYAKDDIRILADADNICFVQLDCRNCMSPIIATVFVNAIHDLTNDGGPKDIKSTSKYFDIDYNLDKAQYSDIGPITSDELLAIYTTIAK